MKKKKIIKALQKQLEVVTKDFDERMQKLQNMYDIRKKKFDILQKEAMEISEEKDKATKHRQYLFEQNMILQSDCKHYSSKVKELTIQNEALLKENSELQGIIEIIKHQLYDKNNEVETIYEVKL